MPDQKKSEGGGEKETWTATRFCRFGKVSASSSRDWQMHLLLHFLLAESMRQQEMSSLPGPIVTSHWAEGESGRRDRFLDGGRALLCSVQRLSTRSCSPSVTTTQEGGTHSAHAHWVFRSGRRRRSGLPIVSPPSPIVQNPPGREEEEEEGGGWAKCLALTPTHVGGDSRRRKRRREKVFSEEKGETFSPFSARKIGQRWICSILLLPLLLLQSMRPIKHTNV